jgi:hypothetical protein
MAGLVRIEGVGSEGVCLCHGSDPHALGRAVSVRGGLVAFEVHANATSQTGTVVSPYSIVTKASG